MCDKLEYIQKRLEEERQFRIDFRKVFDKYDITGLSEELLRDWDDVIKDVLKPTDDRIVELENKLKNFE